MSKFDTEFFNCPFCNQSMSYPVMLSHFQVIKPQLFHIRGMKLGRVRLEKLVSILASTVSIEVITLSSIVIVIVSSIGVPEPIRTRALLKAYA